MQLDRIFPSWYAENEMERSGFEVTLRHEKAIIIAAGCIIGALASLLVYLGNPSNMGFCIACFLRDISGALGLHSAANVQYIRPEIIGLVLGSFLLAVFRKEFGAKGGSSPLTRFVLGMFVMVGCLMFLGCPFPLRGISDESSPSTTTGPKDGRFLIGAICWF